MSALAPRLYPSLAPKLRDDDGNAHEKADVRLQGRQALVRWWLISLTCLPEIEKPD